MLILPLSWFCRCDFCFLLAYLVQKAAGEMNYVDLSNCCSDILDLDYFIFNNVLNTVLVTGTDKKDRQGGKGLHKENHKYVSYSTNLFHKFRLTLRIFLVGY